MTAPVFTLTIAANGIEAAALRLTGVESRAYNWMPAQGAVVEQFRALVKEAFDTEGSSTEAGAWQPLSPRTQRQRQRLGYGPAHPILQRSGRLYRALAEGEGAYVRNEPQRLQVQLGEDVRYFVYHQSAAPRTRLPRRAMVALTAQQRARLIQPIRDYITRYITA